MSAAVLSLIWTAQLLLTLTSVPVVNGGTPAPEQFFHDQLVDHLNDDSSSSEAGEYGGGKQVWTQRYYTWDKEFQGPGHPIIVILGGEGAIEPHTGLFYPFVTHHLAKIFGAYVVEPEHRFYGKSQPVVIHNPHHTQAQAQDDPRVQLFTSEQALHDAMYLVDSVKETLGCSVDKFSKEYCPVLTVGGSYPGFLSAMARLLFPEKVDMAYAASAPMGFYSQKVNQYSYYDLITQVAEDTLEGCSNAVRSALRDVKQSILKGNYNESALGICPGSTPSYLHADDSRDGGLAAMLVDELMMVVEYSFANANMANYPPSNQTILYSACQTFTSPQLDSSSKVKDFLSAQLPPSNKNCWNFTSQLPSGPNATISSGDWSGVGTGVNGESWDFQTCSLLIEAIGMSKESMFPPRDWSLEWLNNHCMSRFGVTPQPLELVRRWGFDKLAENNVTRILFTNGLKDGWSVGGIKQNLSDSLIALHFPNGTIYNIMEPKRAVSSCVYSTVVAGPLLTLFLITSSIM
jgi:hypothetical protein